VKTYSMTGRVPLYNVVTRWRIGSGGLPKRHDLPVAGIEIPLGLYQTGLLSHHHPNDIGWLLK